MRPRVVAWLDRALGAGWGEILAPDYVILLALAMIVSMYLTAVLARRRGLDMTRVFGALVWTWLGAMIGARLLTSIANVPDAIVQNNVTLLARGGLTAYGGFLGGTAAAWIALGKNEMLALGDLMAPSLGVATSITRLGCFLAGCDFGAVTTSRFAIRYPPDSPAFHAHLASGWVGAFSPTSLAVHPTQLYESALGLVVAATATITLAWRWKKTLDGSVLFVAAATYATGRIAIEAMRGDVDRGVFGFISTSQIVSAVILATVTAIVAVRKFR